MKKQLLACILAASMMAGTLAGCGGSAQEPGTTAAQDKSRESAAADGQDKKNQKDGLRPATPTLRWSRCLWRMIRIRQSLPQPWLPGRNRIYSSPGAEDGFSPLWKRARFWILTRMSGKSQISIMNQPCLCLR